MAPASHDHPAASVDQADHLVADAHQADHPHGCDGVAASAASDGGSSDSAELEPGRAIQTTATDETDDLRNTNIAAARQRRRARAEPLVYRPVGNPGDRYPAWLHAVKGASGVYVIRQHYQDGTREVRYVGESHTGGLYKTLTRHFQHWQRWKEWWRGQYGEGHDPGLTYERGSVDVAIRVTTPDDALDEEARLIRRLRPMDNLRGQADLEDAPF